MITKHGRIFIPIIVCVIFSSIFAASSISGILTALFCAAATAACTHFYLKSKKKEQLSSVDMDKWLDLLFLLENYEVTDKNRSIVVSYISHVQSEPGYPPTELAQKINFLLEKVGLEAYCLKPQDSKKTYGELARFVCLTFGLCGMLSSIIAFSFLVNNLSAFFWIATITFCVGIWLLWRATSEEKKRKIIMTIGVSAVALFLVLGFFINISWRDEQFSSDNIKIWATSKTDSVENGYSYKTVFSFSIKNKSPHNIRRITGTMVFYDGKEEIGNAQVSFVNTVPSRGGANMSIDFSGSDAVYQRLYSTPFNKLKIGYKITAVDFQNNGTRMYDGAIKAVK